ncbi:MAG: oligopeptidase B [Sulfobacillus acidophilus]|uniref:Oligopeptidase B n=1 Tax=Sulfobacillus acidophilus TaxID=53633 RepID=A0A2T2WFC5_9FIRM|nr:MAG: oligopeptidase B [Sulfobacillus acidophilus]
MKPPRAPRHPHIHTIHQDSRPDDYYWMADRHNPEVIEYLTAENQYFAEMMQPLYGLQEALYHDMRSHFPSLESSVPAQYGAYYYYWRINPGQEYRTYYRNAAEHRNALNPAWEEVLLDVNALAADHSGYLDVSTVQVSPDHQRLLYLENRDGTDRYTLHVVDLNTKREIDEPIPNVFIHASVAWDELAETVYYLGMDETQRPFRLYRHRIGGHGADELLFEEQDISFSLKLSTSRSGRYLFLSSRTKTESEVWYLSTRESSSPLELFQGRRAGILYELEHWQDRFLNLTNENAQNFRVLQVSADHPDPAQQSELIAHHPSRYLTALTPFQKGLVISGREAGLRQIWTYTDGSLKRLSWSEPLYTVQLGPNYRYDTDEVLISYQSLITPKTDYAMSLETGEKTFLRQEEIPGYDASQFHQERLWARAEDGTPIPISLVGRRDAFEHKPCPTILYGYGSYGASSDPTFDHARLALLDRGLLFAIAHVRGGSEMGYGWYQDGKLLNKRHTFTDFIDVAQYLVNQGYTTPQQLAASGRSAGGLLMGAIANMRPGLFAVVSAGVPFVDVVTTMLDASIPLTALEWDEWGNPADEKYYAYIKSYSPYDNVAAQDYPHLFVYTGFNDPRVGYFEPAKWVARLRCTKTDGNMLLFKINMSTGHFGTSGRLGHLRDRAEEYAFILDKLRA